MTQTDKIWYLVQCKPREAFRAEEHLNNQNFECFLPTHPVKRARGGCMQWVTEPLFPHYLFARLGIECNWGAIRSTRGVSKIVGFNGKPAKVADYIVQSLQRHCAAMNGTEPGALYHAGEEVTITEGCFRELDAIVKTTKGDERVILLLNILNRQSQIEVPVSVIAPKA